MLTLQRVTTDLYTIQGREEKLGVDKSQQGSRIDAPGCRETEKSWTRTGRAGKKDRCRGSAHLDLDHLPASIDISVQRRP